MPSTAHSVQLTALCERAEKAWYFADEEEATLNALGASLAKLSEKRLWARHWHEAALLDAEIARNKFRREEALTRFCIAQAHALRKSEVAARYGWGVRIGHEYQVQAKSSRFPLVVSSLRPLASATMPPCMLCKGTSNEGLVSLLLGLDDVTFCPAASNIIHMAAKRALLCPARLPAAGRV